MQDLSSIFTLNVKQTSSWNTIPTQDGLAIYFSITAALPSLKTPTVSSFSKH
jgi:hypothetical protein